MEDNERDGPHISGDQRNHKEERFQGGVMADWKTKTDTDGDGDEYIEVDAKDNEYVEVDAKDDEYVEVDAKDDEYVEVDAKDDEYVEVDDKHDEYVEVDAKHDEYVEVDAKDNEYVEVDAKDYEYVEVDAKDDEYVEVDAKDNEYVEVDAKDDEYVEVDAKDDEYVEVDDKHDDYVEVDDKHDDYVEVDDKHDDYVEVDAKDDEYVEVDTKHHEYVVVDAEDDEYVEIDTKDDEYVEVDTKDCEYVKVDAIGDQYVELDPKDDEHSTQSPELIVFQFYHYAMNGRCDKIQEMIFDNGISINTTDSNGRGALMLATEWRDKPAQEILLENGALPQLPTKVISDLLRNEPRQDVCVRQIFETACLEYSFPEFNSVVINGEGIDINVANADGQSALMMAVETKELNAVCVLMAAGFIVSEQVVQRALDLKHFKILEVLLQSGPTVCDTLWLELLQLALCAGHRALVEAGQRSKSRFRKTQLARASRLRSVEAVSRLVEAGVDVNMADSDGRMALHAAVIHGDVEMLKVLIGNGAEVNIQDNTSNIPLDFAVNSDNFVEEVVQELKLAGAISVSSIQGDQNKNLRDVITTKKTITKNDFVSNDVQSPDNATGRGGQDSSVYNPAGDDDNFECHATDHDNFECHATDHDNFECHATDHDNFECHATDHDNCESHATDHDNFECHATDHDTFECHATDHDNFECNATDNDNLESYATDDDNLESDDTDDDNLEYEATDDDNLECDKTADENLKPSTDLIVFQLYDFAAFNRHDKLLTLLREPGISINATGTDGRNALKLAADERTYSAQKILLKNGAL